MPKKLPKNALKKLENRLKKAIFLYFLCSFLLEF